MYIFCDKQELIEAVGNVQRAVATKAALPALEGILLRAQGSTLYLAGFDMELGITTTIDATVKEPGVKLAPSGLTIQELIDEYCGGMADGHTFAAYLAPAHAVVGVVTHQGWHIEIHRQTGLPLPDGLAPGFLTANPDFYRVDTALTVPRVDLDACGGQRRAVPGDAGPAAQHRDGSTDHGDPPVAQS